MIYFRPSFIYNDSYISYKSYRSNFSYLIKMRNLYKKLSCWFKIYLIMSFLKNLLINLIKLRKVHVQKRNSKLYQKFLVTVRYLFLKINFHGTEGRLVISLSFPTAIAIRVVLIWFTQEVFFWGFRFSSGFKVAKSNNLSKDLFYSLFDKVNRIEEKTTQTHVDIISLNN